MTQAEEIAWAAGLFEGEGCIALQSYPRRKTVQLSVSSTDLDVLQRFRIIVDCGNVREVTRFRPAGRKRIWVWTSGSRPDVHRVIDWFWPYLGERRRDKATDAFAEATPLRSKSHCQRGHEMTVENTYRAPSKSGRRQCRKCMADGQRRRREAGKL